MDPGNETTGTRDEHFDLVSVLYHALQGADACGRYAADAEAAGDERLAAFFREAQATQRSLAERAKGMLGIGGVVPDTAGAGNVPPRSAGVQRDPDVSAEEVDTTTATAEGAPPMLDAPPAPPSTVARPDEDLLAETRGAAPEDAPPRERGEAEGQTEGGGQEGEGLVDRVKDALRGPDEPERRTGH
jgi:hypothetical protein